MQEEVASGADTLSRGDEIIVRHETRLMPKVAPRDHADVMRCLSRMASVPAGTRLVVTGVGRKGGRTWYRVRTHDGRMRGFVIDTALMQN